MRTLQELLDATSPAWPLVQEWLASASSPVEVLPRDEVAAGEVLQQLQVTTRSTLGAVAYETGGLLVDQGWLRVLGSGGVRMRGSLANWNALGVHLAVAPTQGMLLVAHDVLGGHFALDGGALGEGRGGAFYFAPDSLKWEDLGRGYSDLLAFFLGGDLSEFYGAYRWSGWSEDVSRLSPDEGFSLHPPLWTAEGKDPALVSRRAVPMTELLNVQLEFARQLDGTAP
ncbi:DUF2625 family protein [Myxococcus llanfairpwllgwyngyllgogerychwyrndrobwllllantysiliogogogochensis]|uniref:DUF2625 family protein n=1 Tax=Myxococcus llanfairpwllgwyngyllgogerychwyrndrobwllllantysiliogogogochensis TaxID=2590453 RepID=A0A540WX16_9BACT|nr:DUF2625 family protein [Myxococcus llanfairpwllgwyngyllgogerychwyrndrobwllllantysiliogogogochensis]TQF13555.1 DUF2625 family protein [Myxococcus llanfairpwllgwyngyllgogerychwyrndrobwllllantysiliogogogochensis]